MRIVYTIWFLTCLYISIPVSAFAQEEKQSINLETVLKLCGADNLTIQEYQINYKLALAEQAAAKEWWLPVIYAGARTHYLDGAAMNTDGSILTDFNRNNAWAGAGVGLNIDFNTGVYKSSALKQRAIAQIFIGIAEKNKTILKTVNVFFDLQAEQIKYLFLDELVKQADTLSQQLKIQTDAGMRFQSEYLLAKSNLNHLKVEMLKAELNYKKKSAILSGLLNLANASLQLTAPSVLVAIDLNVESSDSSDIENRPEYSALLAEMQALKMDRNSAGYGFVLPKLNLGIDNGQFGDYDNISNNTTQLNASLLWNIPLSRFTSKGDVKAMGHKLMLQENRVEQFKNQFSIELLIAIAELDIVKQQMDISNEALKLTTEALQQSIDRQKLGTAKPFEVFQSQEFYLQARIDYLNAVISHNKAQFQLKVANGQNL